MKLLNRYVIIALVIAVCGGVMTKLLSAESSYGRVTGTLTTADRGARLARIGVSLVRADASGRSFSTTTDSLGRFTFRRVPVGSYRLIAKTHAHQQPSQQLVVREGQTTSASCELQPTDPFVRILQRQQLFTTRETPALRCHGFVPTDAVTVSIYQVAPEVALAQWHGWLPGALSLHGQSLQTIDLRAVPELTFVRALDIKLSDRDRDVEGVFRKEIILGALAPGLYLVRADALDRNALALLTVTDLGLITKVAPHEALIYAVSLDTGKPLPKTAIKVLRGGKVIAGGETGTDGMISLTLPPHGDDDNETIITGRAGASLASATMYTYWYDEEQPLQVYTYTDRPVYRPGHTVYFKSLLRELHGDDYRVPAPVTADVRVTDGNDNPVYTGRHTTNTYGSFAGEFVLNESALPGMYTLNVDIDGHPYETTFSVAEYRKPEYEVTVEPAKKRLVRGETVTATINAQYFYGAPVAGARVEYYISSDPSWYYGETSAWDDDLYEPAYDEDGGYGEGELILSGTGKTDDGGRLVVTIPADKAPPVSDHDWRYSISAYVTDASERSEEGSGGMLLTQGAFRIQATPDRWMARPEETVTVAIQATDYDGKPVPNAAGFAVFDDAVWNDRQQTFTEIERMRWQADASGRATVTFSPPRDGDYRITCTAHDQAGNAITSTNDLWVMSDDYATFDYPYEDLDVRAGKTLYRVGETAEIVVNTRHAPQTALVTIEGQRIMRRELVQLKGKSSVIPVKVTPELMPSVTVGVCFLAGKKLLSGSAVINISRERKALNVRITPDKTIYRPGEKATYRVQARTPDGKPARAEVSLGVVDESIYAIAPDDTPNIVSFFYPKRENAVFTAYSFPEVHLSGDDKAGSTIRTRRNFRDTSFWQPSTVTDAQGRATFTVTMPDNLTTWRATCRAATLATQVGQATAKAVVNKPFLVRLEAPRFFTQGDEVAVAAVVHNLTQETLNATVGLNGGTLDLGRAGTQTCRVAPGKTARLAWTATATAPGETEVRAWAKAGAYDDAMALTLPVKAKWREYTTTRKGSVDSGANLAFTVRDDVVPGTARLTVRLTPTIAGAMLGSLDYLATYPYGCVEQTMSGFLPDVMLVQMLNKLGIDKPALRAKLPKMVDAGLLKLYGFQHEDGGWGWWNYDSTDTWMTAYVVYGLLQARAAGFAINENNLERGLRVVEREANETSGDANTRIYMAYVLALGGRTAAAEKVLKPYLTQQGGNLRAGLSDWGLVALAQALGQTGHGDDGRVALGEAWTRFERLRDNAPGYWERWTDVDIAAGLLAAACELTPDSPRLTELARWLMERRGGDHWYSTRDTAAALYGLSRYLLVARELQPDMDATVTLNGKMVATKHFAAEDVFQPETVLTFDAKALGGKHATLAITTARTGKLYYTAVLTQMATSELYQPLNTSAGLVVERHYRAVDRRRQGKRNPDAPSETIFRNGDVIEVTLTVRAARRFEYLMLEDMLPAGCEAQDRGIVDPWDWSDWWATQITRDAQVGFALRELEPGVHRIVYYQTTQVPGHYIALPPRVYDMYHPDVYGGGVAQEVRIH